MTRGGHYYIVNMDNGVVLAPYITDDRDAGFYGMAVDVDVYQYNQATTRYKNQYKGYRQSYKWLLESVGAGTNLVRFKNKLTGMYLAVKNGFRQAGAYLCQVKDGGINWRLLAVGESTRAVVYAIVNDVTGGSVAVPSAQPGNQTVAVQKISRNGDTPQEGWELLAATLFESSNDATGTPTFEQAGIRDEKWFALARPYRQNGPLPQTTFAAHIDTVGKMIGLLPAQEQLRALYDVFLLALRQLVKQAFGENKLNELLEE